MSATPATAGGRFREFQPRHTTRVSFTATTDAHLAPPMYTSVMRGVEAPATTRLVPHRLMLRAVTTTLGALAPVPCSSSCGGSTRVMTGATYVTYAVSLAGPGGAGVAASTGRPSEVTLNRPATSTTTRMRWPSPGGMRISMRRSGGATSHGASPINICTSLKLAGGAMPSASQSSSDRRARGRYAVTHVPPLGSSGTLGALGSSSGCAMVTFTADAGGAYVAAPSHPLTTLRKPSTSDSGRSNSVSGNTVISHASSVADTGVTQPHGQLVTPSATLVKFTV